MKAWMDIETNGLIEHLVDFSSLPLKLASAAKVWAVGILKEDGTFVSLHGDNLTRETLSDALSDVTTLINHNLIGYDLFVLKIFGLIDYHVPYSPKQQGKLNGRPCRFIDTLVWSKLDNADRKGGHSLANWGRIVGCPKLEAPSFNVFSDELLVYLEGDCRLAKAVYHYLHARVGGSEWEAAYSTEAKILDLTATKQTPFGFEFNIELAQALVEKFIQEMEEIRTRVNAGMPPAELPASRQKEYTPPTKQFKNDGTLALATTKFIVKHGGTFDPDTQEYKVLGISGVLPMPTDPLVKYKDSAIDDIPHVKAWLMSLGWNPTEYAQRDLAVDDKKARLPDDKIRHRIDGYVKQTIGSVYEKDRCLELEVKPQGLYQMLLKKLDKGGSMYVPTMPKIRVGNDKKICPNIMEISEAKGLIEGIARYYTLRHRLSSIAGGTIEYDEETGEASAETGWLTKVLHNGRIMTPANTLGTPTARYKHSVVVNPPKAAPEVIYGKEIRSLFGAGKPLLQLGFDFASLEARCQAHKVHGYFGGQEEAARLTLPAPHDVHTSLVNLLKEAYGIEITRNQAKNIFYGVVYGAGVKKVAKMLRVDFDLAEQVYNAFWEANPALKAYKDDLATAWKATGNKYIKGLDGRQLLVRKQHALLNTDLQAAGAVIVKNALLRIAYECERRGWLGDPFKHSLLTPQKYWFMIVNHDEQQAGVTKDLLSFHKLKKDEVVGEGECEFMGYVFKQSELISIIQGAIEATNKALNLAVPMGIEWKVGRNWAECH